MKFKTSYYLLFYNFTFCIYVYSSVSNIDYEDYLIYLNNQCKLDDLNLG